MRTHRGKSNTEVALALRIFATNFTNMVLTFKLWYRMKTYSLFRGSVGFNRNFSWLNAGAPKSNVRITSHLHNQIYLVTLPSPKNLENKIALAIFRLKYGEVEGIRQHSKSHS